MGSTGRWVIPLSESATAGEELVGGKARTLGGLLRDGWSVPPGVVVSTLAYDRFRRAGDLERQVRIELGRKPTDGMRWEELWDAVLRLRHNFSGGRDAGRPRRRHHVERGRSG